MTKAALVLSKPLSRFVLLAFLVSSNLLFSGCNPASSSKANPSDSAGRTVINFWNGFTGPDGKAMEAVVRQFQQENPDVAVRMQIIPWGTYYDKLTLSLAYGGAPEVFILHAVRLPEFASFGVLRPLDDLYSSSRPPLTARDFIAAPWNAMQYRGHRYALPLDVHPLGLYYNTALFKAAGIVDAQGRAKPPKNWDEFLEDARKMTKDTDGDGRPDQWGFVFTNQRSNWFTFSAQFGSGILTPNGRASMMDSSGDLTALHRMHDLIYTYHVAPKPEGIDAWLAFRQGKAAMAMEGIYMLASLEEQKGLPYAGAPVPQFGPKPAVWGGSHLLCQPSNIAPGKVGAAWRLMRFISDNSLIWAKGGQVPARLAVLHSPGFQALPVQSQFAKEVSYVQYESMSPRINALFPFVDPAIEAVLLDLQPPEAATADASRRINQVLKRP
jgi:multiple sugar transport system substrate-binding protein